MRTCPPMTWRLAGLSTGSGGGRAATVGTIP